MSGHSYQINIQPDFLESQSRAKPIQALAELIWNSVDADATKIEIFVDLEDKLNSSITVRDNGHAIPYEEAPVLFINLGGSWEKII